MNATIQPLHSVELARRPARDHHYVCWSRMQAESGQSLEEIISRKERERRLNDGVFLWGVGNAPAHVASRLARAHIPVPVIFSIMKSRPKHDDAAPTRIVAWRRYFDAEGIERKLPKHSVVTSRGGSAARVKRSHYALMCSAEGALKLERGTEYFHTSVYRNVGGTCAPVGSSQVTALLKRVETDRTGPSDYEINMRAWLTGGYWVRLTDPVWLTDSDRKHLANEIYMDDKDWAELSADISSRPSLNAEELQAHPLLF